MRPRAVESKLIEEGAFLRSLSLFSPSSNAGNQAELAEITSVIKSVITSVDCQVFDCVGEVKV